MTPEEKIKRLEFLIRLLVKVIRCLEDEDPAYDVKDIIDEYCDLHDIQNPLNI